MNPKQMKSAQESMTVWLSHSQELGKAPSKIECTGDFKLHEMTYYLFKYKKHAFGKWMLGVCGGYEGDGTEHCGHVFSEAEEYHGETAVEKAIAMVEMQRSYWMEQGKEAEKKQEGTGSFAGFVLLSVKSWDKQKLICDLETKWEMTIASGEDDEDNLIFSIGDMMAVVSLMPAPVPGYEAEQNAANNYMWPEAVDAAKAHKAHLMVAVLGNEMSLLERGMLFVKVVACCCKQENATGVYTSGTVFEPQFYADFADMMKEDMLPIFNWIWFGLYRGKTGVCCYTYGMDIFGKDNMEILDADADPSQVRKFLSDLVSYVLEENVTLNDGETIGLSPEDKHAIIRSGGVSLPEMTLKIIY